MSKPRLWAWIGGVVALLLVTAGIVVYLQVKPYAQIGVTYISKQMCSCVFVAGRSDASCRAEFEPDIDKFHVAINHHRRSVKARLLLFSNAASYADGYGCTVAR